MHNSRIVIITSLVVLVFLLIVVVATPSSVMEKFNGRRQVVPTASIAALQSTPMPQEDSLVTNDTWDKQISYTVPAGWREDSSLMNGVGKMYVSANYVPSSYGNPAVGTAIVINSSTNKNSLNAKQYLENLKASVGPSDFSLVGISGFQAVRYRNSYEQSTLNYTVVTPTKIWYFVWYIPNKGDVNKEQSVFEQFMKSVKLAEE